MKHLTHIVLPWEHLLPVAIPSIHPVHTTRYPVYPLVPTIHITHIVVPWIYLPPVIISAIRLITHDTSHSYCASVDIYLAPVTIPAIHLVTHDTPHSYCTTMGTSGTHCDIVETSRTRYPVYILIPMIHLTHIVLLWIYLAPIPAIHLVHTTRYLGHTLEPMIHFPTLCNPRYISHLLHQDTHRYPRYTSRFCYPGYYCTHVALPRIHLTLSIKLHTSVILFCKQVTRVVATCSLTT